MITSERGNGYFPVLDWVLGYRKEWVRSDVIAGLPAEVGLYMAFQKGGTSLTY